MAVKTKKAMQKVGTRKVSFVPFQKLQAAITLLAFCVVGVGGAMAGVSLETILFRMFVVIGALFIIGRIVLRVLTTYEEMNGG